MIPIIFTLENSSGRALCWCEKTYRFATYWADYEMHAPEKAKRHIVHHMWMEMMPAVEAPCFFVLRNATVKDKRLKRGFVAEVPAKFGTWDIRPEHDEIGKAVKDIDAAVMQYLGFA